MTEITLNKTVFLKTLDALRSQFQVEKPEIVLQSDDPDDLTLRQARLLGSADLVAHEPGVAEAILLRARADAGRKVLKRGEKLADESGLVVVLRASA